MIPDVCNWIVWVLSLKQKMFDNVFSETGTLKYDASQGSIVRPLLFPLYVNDLPESSSEVGSYLYADDTYIFCKH